VIMIKVIYETPDFIAINKPAGVLVHGTRLKVEAKKEEKTVADWLLARYPEVEGVGDPSASGEILRPGIVHRLDKDTSGVLLVAKTKGGFEQLKSLFQKGRVKKTYKALVWGELRGRGVIDKPIGLKSGSVKRSVHAKRMKMIKPAITEYESLGVYSAKGGSTSGGEKSKEKFSLLDVFPKTGRTHQIRVHLQSIHHPVVGDALYGPRKNPLGLARQFLHAEAIEFLWGQDGEKLRIETDLPDDLQGVLQEIRKIS